MELLHAFSDILSLFFIFLANHQVIFDASLVGLGIAVSRFPQFDIFIRVSILIIRLAQWYFKNHPIGKKAARVTSFDEEIAKLHDKISIYEKEGLRATVIDKKVLQMLAFLLLLFVEVVFAMAVTYVTSQTIRELL